MTMPKPLTDRSRGAIHRATEEADRMNAPYVSTGHILLGLLGGECVAAQALMNLGPKLELEEVREEVLNLHGGSKQAREKRLGPEPPAAPTTVETLREWATWFELLKLSPEEDCLTLDKLSVVVTLREMAAYMERLDGDCFCSEKPKRYVTAKDPHDAKSQLMAELLEAWLNHKPRKVE